MYTVFGIEACPSCRKAKDLLKRKKIEFTYINLDEHPDKFNKLQDLGLKTVPQVFDGDGNHVGGYEALEAHLM